MSITTTLAQGKRGGRHSFPRVVAACLALILALAACGGTTSTPSGGGGPVTMGVLSCFTGTLASLGQAMLQGAQVAQKAINDAGGILGRQLNLAHADTQCDEADSVVALRQLQQAAHTLILEFRCNTDHVGM